MKWIVFAVLVGCGSKSPPSKEQVDTRVHDATADVLTTVARHELKGTDAQKSVCIATRGADNAVIVAALKPAFPNAVPDAECSGGGPDGSSVTGPAGPGVRIDIGPVTVIGADANQATCNGGGAYVSGGAREIQYSLERTGSTWAITGEKILSEM